MCMVSEQALLLGLRGLRHELLTEPAPVHAVLGGTPHNENSSLDTAPSESLGP